MVGHGCPQPGVTQAKFYDGLEGDFLLESEHLHKMLERRGRINFKLEFG